MSYSPIIAPVVALAILQLLLSLTLVPTVFRANFRDPPLSAEERQAVYSKRSESIRDQPILFYVVCFVLAYIGAGSGVDNSLAWAFVALWMTHKLPESLSKSGLRRGAGWAANINLCALAAYAAVLITRDLLAG